MSSISGVQPGDLLNAIPDACAIIEDSGKILSTNSAWDALWAEHSDVSGKNYSDLLARVREQCPNFAKAIDQSSPLLTWCDLAHPDKHFEVTYSRLNPDSVFVTYKDLTEQTNSLRELEATRKKLNSIMQDESECIKTMDPDGQILEMNAGGFKILRATSEADVLGKSVFDFVFPADHGAYRRALTLAQNGIFQILDCRICDTQGENHWVRTSLSPILGEDGSVESIISITRDLSVERSLEASEQRFQHLADAMPFIVWTADSTGELDYANSYFYKFTGADSSLLPQRAWTSVIHPDDVPACLEAWENATRNRTHYKLEFRIKDRDGEYRWHFVRAVAQSEDSSLPPKWYGTGIDIHDNKLEKDRSDQLARDLVDTVAALTESEERFRIFSSASNDAIWDWQIGTQELWWNEGFLKLFGQLSPEEDVSAVSTWQARIHPDDREWVIDSIRKAINSTSPRWEAEYRFKKEGGEYALVKETGYIVRDGQGNALRMIGGMSDLTERRRLEDQVLRSQRLDSLGTLAGGIAHDLNNVFTPILFSTQLLREERDPDEVAKNVTLVESCARRGAQMVAQLLAFARGTEGRRIPLSLTSLLKDILRITRETFPKSISIRAHISSDLMPVEGDSSQLHQVLMNLCVNARDAMPSGGVLEIHAENLDVDEVYAGMTHEAHAGHYVRIEVKDNGTGMNPDVLEHLFEPFFTTKEVGKGTGLGLSTTHSIVKGHGGFVRVYSELGEGSTFHVYLPALLDTLSEVSEPFAPAELIPKGRGELILVVDDEPDIRLMVERTLQHFGYQVLLAEHGAEAVSVYANYFGKVSLVITDMAMPIMDGPSTIAALRAMDPNVKIIGSSGFANRAASSSDLDLKHFVPKPYSASTLLSVIRQVLDE
jgi:PAS domain S-box-containing protein